VAGNPLGAPENQWQFLIQAPPTSRIRGTIRLGDGSVVPGVTVHVGDYVTVTNSLGVYEVTGLNDGTYEVRPELTGKAFLPAAKVIRVPPDQIGIDFTAVTGYAITGLVTLLDGVTPVSGVKVSAGAKSDLTLPDGTYALTDLAAGTYTVVPVLPGLIFSPPTHIVTITTANIPNQNFLANYAHYSIAGRVATSSGTPVSGVSVTAYDASSNPVATVLTGEFGTYLVPNLLPGRYTLRAVKATWAFAPGQTILDLSGDVSGINFEALTVAQIGLLQDLNFVGVPVFPTSDHPLDVFLGAIGLVRYDPDAADPTHPWVFATPDPVPDLLRVAPGKGFFVRMPADGTISVPGRQTSRDAVLEMPVSAGWNMLANPYGAPMPWAALGIIEGMPLRNVGFIWSKSIGYRTVSSVPGVGILDTVPVNAAFWIFSTDRTTARFNPAFVAPAQSKVVRPASTDCLLRVVASTRDSSDATTVVGFIVGHEMKAENPPVLPGMVDLYVDEGPALAAAIRSRADRSMSWNLTVRVPDGADEVAISAPDLSRVPADKQVLLTDIDGGRSIYLRTQPRYVFAANGPLRHLRLSIEDRAAGSLTISAASARQRGAGAVVTFSLSRSATVSAEVLNIAGRTVCSLAAGQPASAGVNSLAWNLRNAQGSPVSPGRYIVKVTVVADDGQQVAALTQLMVGR
jgi:hypothetical protein